MTDTSTTNREVVGSNPTHAFGHDSSTGRALCAVIACSSRLNLRRGDDCGYFERYIVIKRMKNTAIACSRLLNLDCLVKNTVTSWMKIPYSFVPAIYN